jgi:subtilisin family serine protease
VFFSFCLTGVPDPTYAQNDPPKIIIVPNKEFPSERKFVPGQIVVKFKAKSIIMPAGKFKAAAKEARILKNSIENLNTKHRVEKIEKVFEVKDTHPLAEVYMMDVPVDEDVLKAVDEYSRDPNVQYAEPVYINHINAAPNDPFYRDFRLNTNQWSLFKINAPLAWDITKGSTNDVIAVLDTGVDLIHEDLAAKIWTNPGESGGGKETNGIDDDGNGKIDDYRGWDFTNHDNDPTDDNHHGTHCSGIIAGVTNNGKGIAGINWNGKIMALKVMDSNGYGDTTRSALGIKYAADMGAKVLSMSYGGGGWTQTEQDAVNYAWGKGCVLVASAGNDNNENQSYPAAFTNVIAVAATATNDAKASYSSYGTWVDVSAPGGDTTPYPYGMILSTYWETGYSNTYAWSMGTSMAGPCVAGVVSLIGSKNPGWTNLQVRDQLENTCDNIDAMNPGYTGKLGKGRINAYQALNVNAMRVGSTESWEWKIAQPGDLITSGTPNNWTWRTWEAGSGRKIPQGSAPIWNWMNE